MTHRILDPKQKLPVTYYMQVEEDLRRQGIEFADLQPGAEDVVWVAYGPSHRPISLYYIFQNGRIRDVQVD
jgi:16S rRNA U516 pseudouridylate synthase RsuA-like enzyme